MGHDLSKFVDPIVVVINAVVEKESNDTKGLPSRRITTIAPNYNSGELDSSSDVSTLISTLLEDAERKLKSKDYTAYVSLLQRTSNLGSAFAAAKLGSLYLHGLQGSSASKASSFKDIILPNYELSARNYFLALKLINLINYTLWDMNLILEVFIGITELYRYQLDRESDFELWDDGITILKQFDSTLNESQFIRFQTHENNQIRKACRVHILFNLANTKELDRDFVDALRIYQDCENIGLTSVSFSADKLIKKSHTKVRLLQKNLEKGIPNVLPICVQCDFEPKGTKEIWKLLVCAKCQRVACCSRQCLQLHIANDH
ncbi:5523_t:CDS:1 [Funneliformis mosseae]|uniref:5523_t:CDS:1 n=1 Tax=Funneliformis mosseae TaxID=27381 RepID=A0A9N9HIH2_FUNMO|nr:5523_t:CDS:1 [Funneliformis mosseae]